MARRHFGSVRKLPSGRWQARYEHEGKIHSGPHTFLTKSDAFAYLSTVEADVHRGSWIDPRAATKTVSQVADQWLASNPTKRASTRTTDEDALRLRIRPAIGDRLVGRVQQPDVQAMVNQWTTEIGPRSVRRTYGVLRAVFTYAVSAGVVAQSPCRNVKLPRVEPGHRHALTPQEVADLARAVGDRYSAAVYVAAVIGLRWSEIAGLKVGALDLDAGTLSVREVLVRTAHNAKVTGPPKSDAGRRTVSLPPALVAMLRAHLERLGLSAKDSDAYVFPAPGGGPIDYSNWRRRYWVPACEAVGLIGVGFHDLRRAAATALVLQGVDMKTAQVRLGHADPRMTLAVYAQATSEADRSAADRLGSHFGIDARVRPLTDSATPDAGSRRSKRRRPRAVGE